MGIGVGMNPEYIKLILIEHLWYRYFAWKKGGELRGTPQHKGNAMPEVCT